MQVVSNRSLYLNYSSIRVYAIMRLSFLEKSRVVSLELDLHIWSNSYSPMDQTDFIWKISDHMSVDFTLESRLLLRFTPSLGIVAYMLVTKSRVFVARWRYYGINAKEFVQIFAPLFNEFLGRFVKLTVCYAAQHIDICYLINFGFYLRSLLLLSMLNAEDLV